ncbi:MAG: DUF3179 domain-containing protein [Fimbriimonadaceae bacterium]|nr:DUF3179 domain-containing protein [Chitinophagales bacterium]
MYINKKIPVLYFTAAILFAQIFFTRCSSRSQANTESNTEDTVKEYKYYADWAVNTEYVLPGCEGGYDCIKSIDKPKFISIKEATLLQDDDIVVGIKIGNVTRCYPHRILNWHEIVNDKIADEKVAINYCPLTGSAMAWNRIINGKETTFGVSGLLFNSNVIPYDRETGSHWSQMKQQCINGAFYKQVVKNYNVIETTWKTWKKLYPESEVLSFETGFTRDYNEYPYFDYMENEDIFFETEFDNDSLFQKERLFGIINNNLSGKNDELGQAKCYFFNNFKHGITVINDSVFGKNIVLIGSLQDDFIVAYENNINGNKITLKPIIGKLPAIVTDEAGNLFDVLGNCIEGNLKGSQLKSVDGFIAYWFAWAAFYPEVELYKK